MRLLGHRAHARRDHAGLAARDLNLGSLPFLHGPGLAQYTSDRSSARNWRRPSKWWHVEAIAPSANHRYGSGAGGKLSRWGVQNLGSGEPRAPGRRFMATYSRPPRPWDDLKFLRRHTKLPILLKDVLYSDDASKALELGLDGLVVSNHGDRQIDGRIASLDALSAIAEAVNGKVPVLFDSGVRGGADVFKALALGACGVCLDRPYVYDLAVAGQRGVEEVIGNLLVEFDLSLGLAGSASVREITRDARARRLHRGAQLPKPEISVAICAWFARKEALERGEPYF